MAELQARKQEDARLKKELEDKRLAEERLKQEEARKE